MAAVVLAVIAGAIVTTQYKSLLSLLSTAAQATAKVAVDRSQWRFSKGNDPIRDYQGTAYAPLYPYTIQDWATKNVGLPYIKSRADKPPVLMSTLLNQRNPERPVGPEWVTEYQWMLAQARQLRSDLFDLHPDYQAAKQYTAPARRNIKVLPPVVGLQF